MVKSCVLSNGFLEYLINKYFVFDPLADLDESNTIDDIDVLSRKTKIVKSGGNGKRLSEDERMIELCKGIIGSFRCYPIGNYKDQLCESDASEIYAMYKKYKCASMSKTRETETSLYFDSTLNTDRTFFVESLDTVTTRDLVKTYGDPIHSGNDTDDHRYEYPFRFAMGGKVYTFSLYDYRDDNNQFYDFDDIFWHVASNTQDDKVINNFVEHLLDQLK